MSWPIYVLHDQITKEKQTSKKTHTPLMKLNIIKNWLDNTHTNNAAKKLTRILRVTVTKASEHTSRCEGQITHRGFSNKD